MGRQLLPPNRGNPHGYFEDAGMVAFQDQLLQTRGRDMFVTAPFSFEPLPAELSRARQLIAARAQLPLWGWKDPRTSLFLDFWQSLLPEAAFIFLYRHPLDVMLSLLRRGDFSGHGQLEIGLQSWQVYNQNIVNFIEKNRDNCFLCHIYSMVDQLETFALRLRQRFNLDLTTGDARLVDHYRPENLKRTEITVQAENVLHRICPPVIDLYHRLENLADLPKPPGCKENTITRHLSQLDLYLDGLSGPVEAAQSRGLLLLLAAALAPDTVQQFYSKVSRSLQTITTERDRLYDSGPIQAYETVLNSQDLLTRRWLQLTRSNLLDIWHRPNTTKQKLKRWIHYRVRSAAPVFGQDAKTLPGESQPAGAVSGSGHFSPDEIQWLEDTKAAAPDAIALIYPEWRGVRSATINLFSAVLLVDEHLDKISARRLARLLAQTGCRRFVFSGFAQSHHRLVTALHQTVADVKIYVFWLGNFLQLSEDYNWDAFSRVRKLCEQGLIYKWGFAKKGMAEVMAQTGIRTGFVMSKVNHIPTRPSTPLEEGPHLGIWSLGAGWRKPPYAMLAASKLIPGAVIYGSGAGSRTREFAAGLQIDTTHLDERVIPQAQMPDTLARMHLNLYVTLSECAPMLPLESLSVGVPCLFGPNSHLFEDHDFLHQSLVVPYPDSSQTIAEYARQALTRRNEIIEAYRNYAPAYNARAQASLAEFLEL